MYFSSCTTKNASGVLQVLGLCELSQWVTRFDFQEKQNKTCHLLSEVTLGRAFCRNNNKERRIWDLEICSPKSQSYLQWTAVHVRTCVCVCSYNMYVYACVHVCAHTCMRVHVHMCVCAPNSSS
jgi:hypothetical protein